MFLTVDKHTVRKNYKQLLTLFIIIIMIAAVFVGCNSKEKYLMALSGSYTNINDVPKANPDAVDANYQHRDPAKGETVATIHTNYGDISLRFFPEAAPLAVNNFIALAKAEKYNNTIFHRVIDKFMIQGGDYTNFNGTGGESIYGEEFDLEIAKHLHNIEGAVAMANRGPGTNGSQFYINQVDNGYLDGNYTVFAQVYEGMDVVNDIAAVKTDSSDKPVSDVIIESVELHSFE